MNCLITNVNVVLENEVIKGTVEINNGLITHVGQGASTLSCAIDGQDNWLLPGFIELHTDNMEKFFTPRPGVSWPSHSAMSSHDALLVSSGITTALDAVSVGDFREGGHRLENLMRIVNAIEDSEREELNRAAHYLHLRCELIHPETLRLFRSLMDNPRLKLVSLMDHSPGQRQYTSLEKYREYNIGKYNFTDEQMAAHEEYTSGLAAQWSQPNREAIARLCRGKNIAMASHDDATAEHVEESWALGMKVAEFPTTPEAAKHSRECGLYVVMGAPNVVRGGSHSGNVSAWELAAEGTLHILSSDYYPASLADAVFTLAEDEKNAMTLSDAAALVSRNPAQVLGFHDRGLISEGMRGDLVLISRQKHRSQVRSVWREGRCVF